MIRLLRHFGPVAASLVVAAPASAQDGALDRIGPLEDVYESYNDCFAATENGSIDKNALIERGWSASEVDAEGAMLTMFARSDRAPTLMTNHDGGMGMCVVMARFEDVASINRFLSAWEGKLPAFEDGETVFSAKGRPIIFRLAGTQQEPRLNLVVGTPTETKE